MAKIREPLVVPTESRDGTGEGDSLLRNAVPSVEADGTWYAAKRPGLDVLQVS